MPTSDTKSSLLVTLAVAFALAVPTALAALSVPHVFSNGTVADADQVNENFAALASEVTNHADRFSGFGVHTAWFRSQLSTSCGNDCEFKEESLSFHVPRTSTVVVHYAVTGHFRAEGAHAYWTVRGTVPGLPEERCITMGGTGQWHQNCSGFVVARKVPPGHYQLWFRAYAGELFGTEVWSNSNSGRRLLVEVFPEG